MELEEARKVIESKELVEKTAAIARLSIQATLAARMAETKGNQEVDPFEAALGQVQGKLRNKREGQEVQEKVELLEEQLRSAGGRADQMAAALVEVQEALVRA